MTPAELKRIRAKLGLTQVELGQWLRLDATDPGHTVRMWEIGKRPISGPVAICLEVFASGWRPAHIINQLQQGTTNG